MVAPFVDLRWFGLVVLFWVWRLYSGGVFWFGFDFCVLFGDVLVFSLVF